MRHRYSWLNAALAVSQDAPALVVNDCRHMSCQDELKAQTLRARKGELRQNESLHTPESSLRERRHCGQLIEGGPDAIDENLTPTLWYIPDPNMRKEPGLVHAEWANQSGLEASSCRPLLFMAALRNGCEKKLGDIKMLGYGVVVTKRVVDPLDLIERDNGGTGSRWIHKPSWIVVG